MNLCYLCNLVRCAIYKQNCPKGFVFIMRFTVKKTYFGLLLFIYDGLKKINKKTGFLLLLRLKSHFFSPNRIFFLPKNTEKSLRIFLF